MNSSVEDSFNHTEFFKRTDSTHVVILEHAKIGIFEVIFSKPDIDIVVPRAYIDKAILHTHINNIKLVDSNLSFASCITDKSLAEYASGRIRSAGLDQAESNKLEPHITEHHQLLISILVNEARRILHREPNASERNKKAKTLLSTHTTQSLTNNERWRMPLVIAKVQRDMPLSLRDKKIFQQIQINLQPDKDDIFHIEFILQSNISTANSTTATVQEQNQYEPPNILKPAIPKLPLQLLYTESDHLTETNSSRERKIQEVARLLITQMTKVRKPKKLVFTQNHHRKRLLKSPKSINRISPMSACSLCTQSSTNTTPTAAPATTNIEHSRHRNIQKDSQNSSRNTTTMAQNTVTNVTTTAIEELDEPEESRAVLKKSEKTGSRIRIIGALVQFCQYFRCCSDSKVHIVE